MDFLLLAIPACILSSVLLPALSICICLHPATIHPSIHPLLPFYLSIKPTIRLSPSPSVNHPSIHPSVCLLSTHRYLLRAPFAPWLPGRESTTSGRRLRCLEVGRKLNSLRIEVCFGRGMFQCGRKWEARLGSGKNWAIAIWPWWKQCGEDF